MRFALPASKFKGLQLCHQFFYDLMSLLEAISLNVAKEKVKKTGSPPANLGAFSNGE